MSTREKLIKARLGMLALAEELRNISPVAPGAPARILFRTNRQRP